VCKLVSSMINMSFIRSPCLEFIIYGEGCYIILYLAVEYLTTNYFEKFALLLKF